MTPGIVRLAEVPAAPWKNGGGTTRTLAVHPPGAGVDAFDWRISVAEVTADGPFSPFPGVDRVLVLLAGDGMELVGDPTIRLDQPGAIARFPGERAVYGRLPGGPTRDLNVMVRRTWGSVEAAVVSGPPSGVGWTGLVALTEGLTAHGEALAPGDLVWHPTPSDLHQAWPVGGTGRAVGFRLAPAR